MIGTAGLAEYAFMMGMLMLGLLATGTLLGGVGLIYWYRRSSRLVAAVFGFLDFLCVTAAFWCFWAENGGHSLEHLTRWPAGLLAFAVPPAVGAWALALAAVPRKGSR
jgi:hypothetical protein